VRRLRAPGTLEEGKEDDIIICKPYLGVRETSLYSDTPLANNVRLHQVLRAIIF
jgi:hypothetical protein